MIRTIYFDLGNVIVDVDLGKLLSSFARHSPFERAQLTERLMNLEEAKLIDLGLISLHDFYNAVRTRISLSASYAEFEVLFADIFSPNHSVIDIIEQLNGKLQLGIISNTSEFHYNKIESDFEVITQLNPKILSFKEHAVKPDRRIFEIALQRAGTTPPETLFIDDKIENISGARNIGMKTIHYSKGLDLRLELGTMGIGA